MDWALFLGELTMVHKSPKSGIVMGIEKAMLGERSTGVRSHNNCFAFLRPFLDLLEDCKS